jgi:hypothetical protein
MTIVSERRIWRQLTMALLLSTLAAPAFPTTVLAEEWTLAKQENGIEVYTRPVEGSGIKEFKAIAEVDSSVDGILNLLRDSNRFHTWFPNTPSSKLLGVNGDVRYQYSTMGTPWPISDRDNVLRSESKRHETSGVVDILVTVAPDYYPEQENLVRVRKAQGAWHLEPLAPQRSRVTFTMHLEPGGGIPEWMINARIVATPFEALTNLRTKTGEKLTP